MGNGTGLPLDLIQRSWVWTNAYSSSELPGLLKDLTLISINGFKWLVPKDDVQQGEVSRRCFPKTGASRSEKDFAAWLDAQEGCASFGLLIAWKKRFCLFGEEEGQGKQLARVNLWVQDTTTRFSSNSQLLCHKQVSEDDLHLQSSRLRLE